MKIKEKGKKLIVTWSRSTEKDLTWRKVREHCLAEVEKINNSKEAQEVKAIEQTIKILQHKVDLFYQKRNRFKAMADRIRDTDSDLDIPFGKVEEADNNDK
jgi:hypothetical protein